MTDFIIKGTSKHLTNIMKKINLRQLVEEQINTFDLKYIENLIIDIANKIKINHDIRVYIRRYHWIFPRSDCNLCLMVTDMLKYSVSG